MVHPPTVLSIAETMPPPSVLEIAGQKSTKLQSIEQPVVILSNFNNSLNRQSSKEQYGTVDTACFYHHNSSS